MKMFMYMTLLLLISIVTYGQSNNLVSDQNPRYQESQDKYMKVKESLTALHSTTIQQTYKAYDFREDKQARKEARIQRRHERNLYYAKYGSYYDRLDYYYPGYYYNNYYPYASGYNYYYPYCGNNTWSGLSLGLGLGLGLIW